MKKIVRILVTLFAVIFIANTAQAEGFKVSQEMKNEMVKIFIGDKVEDFTRIEVSDIKDIIEHTPNVAIILITLRNKQDDFEADIFAIIYHNRPDNWKVSKDFILKEDIFDNFPEAKPQLMAAGYFPN